MRTRKHMKGLWSEGICCISIPGEKYERCAASHRGKTGKASTVFCDPMRKIPPDPWVHSPQFKKCYWNTLVDHTHGDVLYSTTVATADDGMEWLTS
jgi:hypothetical protein